MYPGIVDIELFLPKKVLTNAELVVDFPEWTEEQVLKKTGIARRHIAGKNETASDLAFGAAEKLLAKYSGVIKKIDLLLFCTQSPDYALPTSACLLQERLGLSTSCLAFDYNLGCSGYVTGLSLANAMLLSGEVKNVLLLTGETYSKWMDHRDKSVRVIFGDAGTATLMTLAASELKLGPFVYGTDGRGKNKLIVHGSGARLLEDDSGLELLSEEQRPDTLFMDGAEVFSFTIKKVPEAVKAILEKADLTIGDVDWFVFHQANLFMLNHLRKQCRIPKDKFVICLEDVGNTVSNTLPVTLKSMIDDGRLKSGNRVLLIGFGVGYSWSSCIVDWL